MRAEPGVRALLLGAALLALLLPVGAAAQDAGRLLASGRTAFEAGDYDTARTHLWSYLEATSSVTGASRLPQAEALFLIATMETDAAVASQHYTTIADEYPAATVADEALFRLAVYALMTGRPAEARTRFVELRQNYPFSRFQGELPVWIGRTFLAERSYSAATTTLIEGFARVRTMDLPFELTPVQRDALAAEYAYWLATAFQEEGDRETALQYWSLLALDYASSPQAAEARAMLATGGRPVEERPRPEREPPVATAVEPPPSDEPSIFDLPDVAGVPVSGEPIDVEEPAYEEPVVEEPAYEEPAYEEPIVEEPAPVVTEPAYEEPPAVAAEPAYEPPPAAVTPPREEPVVRTPPREEPVVRDAPVVREEPRETPPVEPTRRPDDPDVFKFPPSGAAGARPSAGEAGTAFLQIGAFTSAARAADLSKRLREDGFSSTVEIGIQDGQGYYRVRVGPYRMPVEEPALRATEERLRRMGYPAQRVAVGT